MDEEFLGRVSADPQLNKLDQTQFPIIYRQRREDLVDYLAKELPLSWLNPKAEQVYRHTFEEMRNYWEQELQQAERWDSESISRQMLIHQFPELSHYMNIDHLEQALDGKQSYFARINIVESAVKKSQRDGEYSSGGTFLKKKDKIRLESVVTTPWQRLVLIEEAAHQQTLHQLVNHAQGLTLAQLGQILGKAA